jgi:hypothetical protein
MQRWQSRNATWLRDYRQALKDVKTDAVLATIRATGRAASSRVATDNRWTEINAMIGDSRDSRDSRDGGDARRTAHSLATTVSHYLLSHTIELTLPRCEAPSWHRR